MTKKQKEPGAQVDRRQLLSLGAVAGLAAGAGLTSPRAQGAPALPTVQIAALTDLAPGAEVAFEYPDADSPAVLLRLGEAVEGGIGPDQSVVAYSTLCTHKGCPVSYNAEHKMLICPCHWSSFDPAKNGRMIVGQASQGLPQITLRLQNGMVEAVGVEGLIYGRQQNIL